MPEKLLQEAGEPLHHEGHRDRLRERFVNAGPNALQDYEVLELVLFAVIPRKDTKPLAKQLITQFGGLAGVMAASVDDLKRVKGLSEASATHLKAIHALTQRMLLQELKQKTVLNSWQTLLDYCRVTLAHETREHFRVLYLDRKNQLILDDPQQTGTVDHVQVYPREVVKKAIELSASALILVHNHPSGDPTPSQADVEMTKELVAAAKTLDITVHDHLIIGRNSHSSLKALGLM
jgi:DNA repair protein RadC